MSGRRLLQSRGEGPEDELGLGLADLGAGAGVTTGWEQLEAVHLRPGRLLVRASAVR